MTFNDYISEFVQNSEYKILTFPRAECKSE